jgi:hypothetical protein
MKETEKYSLAEIRACIDFIRNKTKISQEAIEGMELLAEVIDEFKKVNDLTEADWKVSPKGS